LQPGARRPSTGHDKELLWPGGEAEQAAVAEVRRRAAAELEGCPEDMTHDLSIARFLRGHGGDPARAAEFMRRALRYRRDLVEAYPAVRAAREATARDCCSGSPVGLQAIMMQLPNAAEVLKVWPLRAAQGASLDGLPVMVAAPRLIGYDAFEKLDREDKIVPFLAASFEQRAVFLHHLSLQQRRLVKFVDVRDLTGFAILPFLSKGRPLIAKLKQILTVVQDYYPEMLHQVIIFNAPSAISRVMSIVSSILNERMKAKIRIYPVVEAYNEVTRRLNARAIWSWMRQVNEDLSFDGLELTRGAEEYAVRWLAPGQSLHWKISVQWKELQLRLVFLPEDATAKAGRPSPPVQELTAAPDVPREGQVGPVGGAGVVWIALSNATSWKACKVERFILQCS